jgi:hypothetical protein
MKNSLDALAIRPTIITVASADIRAVELEAKPSSRQQRFVTIFPLTSSKEVEDCKKLARDLHLS